MAQQEINPKLKEGILDKEKLDLGSSTYREIKRYLDYKISSLRKKNDNQANAEDTAYTRGKIAALKNLLGKCKDNKMLVKPPNVTK